MSRVCVISGKESWRDETGRWFSNGGFPLQMRGIASLFDEMTLLITERSSPGQGAIALPEQAQVVVMKSPVGSDLRRKISVLSQLPALLGTMARHVKGADVVHVPPPGDLPLLGMLVALGYRKRLIVRYCGSWFVTARTTMTNRVTRGLMRMCAGGRNVMLATGQAVEEPAPGVSWIFSTALSAAELERVQPDCDRGLSTPPRLGYIGRLHHEKGVANLIEALGRLKQEGLRPMPVVRLIGDGPERAQLEAQVKASGLGEQVCFLGQLDRDAMAVELERIDVCVQPSLTEGFSKAWLDAMAFGVPVIGTDAGAARKVIGSDGERGWVVSPGDVGALAGRLRTVLEGPVDWAELRRRCRAFAESRTLESWACAIGRLCAEQWNVPLMEGKLRLEVGGRGGEVERAPVVVGAEGLGKNG